MNNILLFNVDYVTEGAMSDFQSIFYGSNLKFLASDLFEEGLSSVDLDEAIYRAMRIATSGGLKVRQHFMPVFTQQEGGAIRDCKVSKLGLSLIILNANPNLEIVGKCQLKMLQCFLSPS